ncbi:hypothetical protein ACIBEJ_33505 [Nonomuraea sp. NPDC050790]|uniref:hypothetical protein n=1 Tax=Nonomuraea sp. NPDC050790 TaxID=3364371 RepID=UPI0037977336
MRRLISLLSVAGLAPAFFLGMALVPPAADAAQTPIGNAYPCGPPSVDDSAQKVVAHSTHIRGEGAPQAYINNSQDPLTMQRVELEERQVSLETSVGGSIETGKAIKLALDAGLTRTVIAKTATTLAGTATVPPHRTGYAQAMVRFTWLTYQNIDRVRRMHLPIFGWWCQDGVWAEHRTAKIPTMSAICFWVSPQTECDTSTLMNGGRGGSGQPPVGGTAPPTGPQPVTDVRGLADGTLLHTGDTRRIYKMVGGAPVWQATCDDGICATTPRPTTQAVIDAGPAAPRNGSSAVDQRGKVYLFVGGAPIWQDTCAAPVSCGSPVKVSDWSVDARDHMNSRPSDGQLVQAKEGATDLPVAMTLGGALVPFASPQEVIDVGQGGDWASRVVAISGGSYNRIGFLPADGTLVQGTGGGSSTAVAAFVGGAAIPFGSPQEVIDAGYGADWPSKVRAIPTRHFRLLPTVPKDGTLIQGSNGSTPVAAIVGAGRVDFASPQEVVDSGHGADWRTKVHSVPAREFNAIATRIMDGTRIGKAGTTSQGGIIGGAKIPFINQAELESVGYDTRPLHWIPARVWDSLPTQITDGTRIGKAGTTSQGAIVGGAKIPFTNQTELEQSGYGQRPLQMIPARVWDALPTDIADGTRIGKAGTTSQGGVVGGAKIPFINQAELESVGYHIKPLHWIPARIWDALPTQITDGTRIGKAGTTSQGGIIGGAKIPFANQTELEESGYARKPLQWIPARVWDALPTQITDGTRIGKAGTTSQGGVVGGAKIPFINQAELESVGYHIKPLHWIPARVWDALPTQIADGTYVKAPDATSVWLINAGRRTAADSAHEAWTIPTRVLNGIPVN